MGLVECPRAPRHLRPSNRELDTALERSAGATARRLRLRGTVRTMPDVTGVRYLAKEGDA
jgi:hypothetical protein